MFSESENEQEITENIIEQIDIHDIIEEGERNNFRLPKQLRCAAHTINLIITKDVEQLNKTPGTYRTISRRAFSKCQALFNKQNMSTLAAEKIYNCLGRYFLVPNDTR